MSGEEKNFKCAFCGTEQTEGGKILKEGSRPPAEKTPKKKEKAEKKEKKNTIPKKEEKRKSIWD